MTVAMAIACLLVGAAFGVLAFALVRVNPSGDTQRLDTLQDLGWYVSHIDDRWAVLRTVDGKPMLVAQSHETLRGAIDAALGVL